MQMYEPDEVRIKAAPQDANRRAAKRRWPRTSSVLVTGMRRIDDIAGRIGSTARNLVEFVHGRDHASIGTVGIGPRGRLMRNAARQPAWVSDGRTQRGASSRHPVLSYGAAVTPC
jgi:hypothetical protein